ncbi:MAG: IS3-like element ISPar1 family transposase, partial [Psychrobacter sp.]
SCLTAIYLIFITIFEMKTRPRIQKGLGYKSPRQVWFDYYRQAA